MEQRSKQTPIRSNNIGNSVTLTLGGALLGMAMVTSAPGFGGEFEERAGEPDVYRFAECIAPTAPDLTLNPKLRGQAAVRDYNTQVARYNRWIAAVSLHMDCLGTEADADLARLTDAVNAALTEEQDRMDRQAETMRQVLAAGPRRNAKPSKSNTEKVIPELEGAGNAPEKVESETHEKEGR